MKNQKTNVHPTRRLIGRGRGALTANLSGTVETKEIRVDFRSGELSLIEKPIRPAKWKPKDRFIGEMSLQIAWPKKEIKIPSFKVTVVSVHRSYKTATPHFEMASVHESGIKLVKFNNISEGHYIVLLQPKGYRPFIHLVGFTKQNHILNLSPILHPVSSAVEEQILLRRDEKHPYVIFARNFLGKFGYLRPDVCDCEKEELCEHLSSALYLFQKSYKLLPLGTLTVDSFLLMLQPRCGHPDILLDIPEESNAGPTPESLGRTDQDPIVFLGYRWDRFNLKYKILSGTGDMSNEWSIIRGSMNTWAEVSPLYFTETSEILQSDLEFDFRQQNESGYPFDRGGTKGGGNILAHAWGPTHGLVEFDDYEDWGSTNLKAVSTHEIGHALGLGHSSVRDATMYAYYDSGQQSLHEVDVRGIKSLYAPVFRHYGSFVAYPLFAFNTKKGTDSVTIDLGQTKYFLAWGTITMIDALIDYDRDNMCFIDVYEVDGNRTSWRVSGGDHFGSTTSPSNVHQGAYIGYGQKITFRLISGHHEDLEVAGFAIVLVLQ
jgi:hypothetical protein